MLFLLPLYMLRRNAEVVGGACGGWPCCANAGVASDAPRSASTNSLFFMREILPHDLANRSVLLVEQEAANRILPAAGQPIGVDVEHLAARVVAEQQLVRELRDGGAAVDDETGHGDVVLEKRVVMIEFDNRVRHLRIRAPLVQVDVGAIDEAEARFPVVPPEVRAGGGDADLLDDVLADLRDEQPAGVRIPPEPLRVPEAVGVDLAERLRLVVVHERIARGNAVLAVRAVGPERIDAQHLAVRRAET